MELRAGYIGLVGLPNAGKSSLMNALVEEKISIVSAKPQTTRRRIVGIKNYESAQLIFVDAPGFIKAEKGLNQFLEQEALDVCHDADILVAVLPLDAESPEEIEQVLKIVKNANKPVFVVIHKIDLEEKSHRVRMIEEKIKDYQFPFLKLSSTKKSNEDLIQLCENLKSLLPIVPAPYYDDDLYTTESMRDLALEIVREKCFENLHQEVPFQIATRMVKFDETAHPVPRISIEIIVAKETHKGMVVGQGGSMIKKIGSEARQDIEKLMQEKVFLELFARVSENWSQNSMLMKEFGYERRKK